MRTCRSSSGIRFVRQLDGAESSCREKKESGDEREGSFDHDAQQAEGQQAKPDDRIKNEGDERKRPADDEEEAEEEEFDHDGSGFQGAAWEMTA